MHPVVKHLLDSLSSDNVELREEALVQLGMVLERHFASVGKESFYRMMMAHDVFAVSLGETELEDLLKSVGKRVLARQLRPNFMLWALGETTSAAVLETLLSLLQEHNSALDEAEMEELLSAIDRCVSIGDRKSGTANATVLRRYDARLLLETVAKSGSPNNRLLALGILEKSEPLRKN